MIWNDGMKIIMRRVALALVLSSIAVAALAEPVPLPSVDYMATGNMGSRGMLTVRHHEGKLRTDMLMAGLPIPALILVDLTTRKALIHMPQPGWQGAMEVDLGQAGGMGPVTGEGTKAGTSTVAGETCDVWQMTSRQSGNPLAACITADGIHLLTQVTIDGAPVTVMEMTAVTRAPQDPGVFELPPGVPIIRPPGPPPMPGR